MNKLLGHNIQVQLKDGDVLSGMFFDSDDDSIYIQEGVDTVIAIPRENVKLYISKGEVKSKTSKTVQEVTASQAPNLLKVYVNEDLADEIPMPPSVNLMSFNDDIMKIIAHRPKLQSSLAQQSSMHYEPGILYIETVEVEPLVVKEDNSQSSFSMGGDIVSEVVDPSQMIATLSNAYKRKREKK